LEHYGRRFQTVELNNSFYRLPEASGFERWREAVPADFLLAVKASRFLTHIRRLRDPEAPVRLFLERAENLGPKLGPILLQLPPGFRADPARLAGALDQFPRTLRVVVEFRDDSWYGDEVRRVLEERQVALCLADSPKRRTPEWRTAGWGFVRFHEGLASPHPCYGERALAIWADRLARLWRPDEDVFCYFNNDVRACAVRDAVAFARLARQAGLEPTRVPEADEVHLAAP
ncbi:MAG: DUF72 domain-containing protein, partial [Candidatus Dormibacteraeota bacterium]|nr:DUF72 domain-containing protein [Candidatus Dormibacteraeota bacterium]